MGKKTLNLNDQLYDYLLNVSLRETDVLRMLRAETDQLEMGVMQISADQAQFMALLIKLINAQRVIEVGTFTGYSALVMAQATPKEGNIITCDISTEWTAIAQRYWKQAAVDHKIDLRLAPAIDTLNALLKTGDANSFDFAFIDADKQNQLTYYEWCLKLVRVGGLIVIDNVLWSGNVADTRDQTPDTVAIREFNDFMFQDDRVDISMVPIGDGVTLARKIA